MKLKLVSLEGEHSEAQGWEGVLTKSLAEEKQLRKNDAANNADSVKGDKIWTDRLADVANRTTKQLADMKMLEVRYAPEPGTSPHAKLTLFFEGVLGALEWLESNRASSLANESRMICQGAMTKVLTMRSSTLLRGLIKLLQ